jgi:hypothetical protein
MHVVVENHCTSRRFSSLAAEAIVALGIGPSGEQYATETSMLLQRGKQLGSRQPAIKLSKNWRFEAGSY